MRGIAGSRRAVSSPNRVSQWKIPVDCSRPVIDRASSFVSMCLPLSQVPSAHPRAGRTVMDTGGDPDIDRARDPTDDGGVRRRRTGSPPTRKEPAMSLIRRRRSNRSHRIRSHQRPHTYGTRRGRGLPHRATGSHRRTSPHRRPRSPCRLPCAHRCRCRRRRAGDQREPTVRPPARGSPDLVAGAFCRDSSCHPRDGGAGDNVDWWSCPALAWPSRSRACPCR